MSERKKDYNQELGYKSGHLPSYLCSSYDWRKRVLNSLTKAADLLVLETSIDALLDVSMSLVNEEAMNA